MSFEVDDSELRKLEAKLRDAEQHYVKVGVLSSTGGADTNDEGITMIELAAIHEFGSDNAGVPERPFIRITFEVKTEQLVKLQAQLTRQMILGNLTVDAALEILGAWGATEVKRTITDSDLLEANAESTIQRKGSDRPLVDTGRLLGSIGWEVE